jgi:copper chaperone NosL
MPRRASLVLTAAVAAALLVALVAIIAHFQRLPSGPADIAWDHEACAHCRMLVSDPAFAAQIQTRDGRVLAFDDPGCLIAFEDAQHPEEHAVYFHELRGQRWLPRDRTVFVPTEHSPMGYDLGAAEIGTPGAIPLEVARARVLSRRSGAGAQRDAGASP